MRELDALAEPAVVNVPVPTYQCPSAPPNRTGSFAANSGQGPSDAAGTMSYGDYANARGT